VWISQKWAFFFYPVSAKKPQLSNNDAKNWGLTLKTLNVFWREGLPRGQEEVSNIWTICWVIWRYVTNQLFTGALHQRRRNLHQQTLWVGWLPGRTPPPV